MFVYISYAGVFTLHTMSECDCVLGQPIEGFELRNVILFLRHGIRTPLADTRLHVRPANCKMTSSSDQSDVIADFVRAFTNASQASKRHVEVSDWTIRLTSEQ
jgi:hypothetical protein